MTAPKLTQLLMDFIVMENLMIYRKHFLNTPISENMNENRKDIVSFFATLNKKDQELVFKIIKEVQVDTVSNILGVIDGAATLGDLDKDFVLHFKGEKEQLNGSLQDSFLQLDGND